MMRGITVSTLVLLRMSYQIASFSLTWLESTQNVKIGIHTRRAGLVRHPLKRHGFPSIITSRPRPSPRKEAPSFALSPSPGADAKQQQRPIKNLNPEQLSFSLGYLNKHHGDTLREIAVAFTELGETISKKNFFSGGAYMILGAKAVDIADDRMILEVHLKERREKESRRENVSLSLDADPLLSGKYRMASLYPKIDSQMLPDNAVDCFVRKFNRLCMIVDHPAVTGKMVQLSFQLGGSSKERLKDNLYLNAVPHNRYVRKYFYELANNAILDAVVRCSDGRYTNRMKITALFPELNPTMDSYRIGTLLELARSLAITLAEQNLRVRVCVQGSMGVGIFTGIPKSLGGTMRLLELMDWQSDTGEENEGMLGNFVNFGNVGAKHVVNGGTDEKGNKIEQDDVFILLCPQSMVGVETSIIAPLKEMVEAAGDRPVILINPDLTDKISSQGQQSVRGRQDRLDFADSFQSIYHFQCLYISGTSYFPILGALAKMGASDPWIAYQRRDLMERDGELYVPTLATERRPSSELIKASFG